jgi:hypothetical protein
MSAVFDTDEEATKQYNRLRRDTGVSADVLDDSSAEEYFVESQETYSGDTAKMVAYARVLVLRGLTANAVWLAKYTQNQSQEDLTRIYDNLKDRLNFWVDEVGRVQDIPEAGTTNAFFFDVAAGRRGQ